ncbi:MAG: MATE family efflux transporter [Deltaproteobacteria bacterium]|nr:MATE family efflux transporter [Deltaproteobacteria bacterium]
MEDGVDRPRGRRVSPSGQRGSPYRDLTRGSLLSSLWALALPMIVANVLQNAFSVVDMVFVGRLGPTAIAAVAVSGLVMMVAWTLLIGIAISTVATVSRFFGAGDLVQADAAAVQSLILGGLISVFLVFFGLFLGDPVLRVLGATAEMMGAASAYFRIVFTGSFTLVFMFLSGAILRGAGDAKTPMVILMVATTLNILLDPLLIFGPWLFPRLEVRGAAYATVLGQGVAMVLGLWVLVRGHSRIHVHIPRFRVDPKLMKRMILIAIPGTFQGGLRSLAHLGLIKIVALYGTLAVAAFGIGLRINLLVMMVGWAIGGAASTLVGQNLGARRPERAERSAWLSAGIFCVFMVLAGAAFFLFADPVIRLFNRSPGVVEIGRAYLRTITLSYPFLGLSMIFAMSFNGAGDTRTPALIIGLTFIGLMIPLALILPRFILPRTSGIWWAMAVSITLQGIIMVAAFKRGRWKEQGI